MEVVDGSHPFGVSPKTGSNAVLSELGSYELIYAARHLPRRAHSQFPLLVRVCPALADSYVDEHLWLNEEEVATLLAEWERLIRVCQQHEFLPDVDGKRVWKYWKGDDNEAEFQEYLCVLRTALELCVNKGASLHLML